LVHTAGNQSTAAALPAAAALRQVAYMAVAMQGMRTVLVR
jgi:hypothetical protein